MALSYHHLFVPAAEPSLPTLLLLHSTGGNERELLPLARAIAPRFGILSVRGDVNENGHLRFFRRFAEGVFDLDDVRRRTEALAQFVLEAEKQYKFQRSQLIAVGFSNGANLAATTLQMRPEILGGALLLRAMVVLDDAPAPGSLRHKRIFLSNGRFDPLVPHDQPMHLAELFQAAGAEVELHTVEASHGFVSADLALARDWISHWSAAPS